MEQRGLQSTGEVCRIPNNDNRVYSLAEHEGLMKGDRYVTVAENGGTMQVKGLFDSAKGHVYACNCGEDPRTSSIPPSPAVRIVGDLDGETGQVTVLQPDGTYRRFSRWDRIAQGSPAQPNAILRTLPQCGCGGSLGMPRLFDSFAELSAYFFCTFYLGQTEDV